MLKGNLSTRPFYNDRLVTAVIAIVGVLVALLTVFNATRLVALSRERTAIRVRVAADESAAAKLRAEVQTMQEGVDRATLARLAASTQEANQLIDQRTFSWTTLLGLLERTLPPNVRLTSVSPRVDRGTFRIQMAIVARDLDDIDDFINALTASGRFYDVAPTEQRVSDSGSYQAMIQASYLPPAPSAAGRAATTPPAPASEVP